MLLVRSATLALAVLSGAAVIVADDSLLRFEESVLPILQEHCVECHGEDQPESGLGVLSRDRLLQGGDSGPAIIRGNSGQSLLFQRIASREMPPQEPGLSEQQIGVISRWLDEGALSIDETGFDEAAAQRASVSEASIHTRIFFTHCISCHGKWKQEAGLDLRSTAAMVRGGKSGPGIRPGDAAGSLIYRRLMADEMPPAANIYGDSNYVRRVPPEDIERLRQWIDAGAPPSKSDPVEDRAPVAESDRLEHWAFRAVQRPQPPRVDDDGDVRTPIDAFIKARLNHVGLGFSPLANKQALLRRVYFDLLGLPPSPDDQKAFLADDASDAYERLVDRLLASPQYGERWAQHWLDAAGYADSHGKIDRDQFRPYLWRYRDYVIRALNADKPYDEFLAEQIAGDELAATEGTRLTPDQQREKLLATGFLLTASDATDEAAFNFVPNRMAVIAEQLDIFSTAVMGLTMECARCHNHKFDPIPQRDYYRLSAIFQTALDPYDWRIQSQVYYPSRHPLDPLYQRYIRCSEDHEPPEMERFNRPLRDRLAELQRELEEKTQAARQQLEKMDANAEQLSHEELASKLPDFKASLESLRSQMADVQARLLEPGVIHGLKDLGGDPTPVFQLRRGDPLSPGMQVQPGIPRALEPVAGSYKAKPLADAASSGNRLALAEWLCRPTNPLTARVFVNRIWQHHFGTGIVETPGNFGAKGASPSHAELLDWLASEFIEQGWSVKKLHRLILTSTAYRQASQPDHACRKLDADNRLLSRFPYQRLDGEAIRDAMLSVSGLLDPAFYGPPVGVHRSGEGEVTVDASDGAERRSIYLAKMRMRPVTIIEQFDGPEMTPNCLQRTRSTVPTQALQLRNSEFLERCAAALAKRLLSSDLTREANRIALAYRYVFAREPDAAEVQRDLASLGALEEAWRTDEQDADRPARARVRAWESYCHTLLNSPEFIYID